MSVRVKQIPGKITGQYIITLKPTANAIGLIKAFSIEPIHTYNAILNGFSAKLTPQQANALKNNPHVESIEEDGIVEGSGRAYWKTLNKQELDENGDPWGLDRIDQLSTRATGTYRYLNTGKGVTAFVLDTGIDYSHSEFEGRAIFGYDAFGGNGADRDGHGTHVAGTIGGKKYGVAKEVKLVSVKVLDDTGSGTWSGIIAGMDWVIKNKTDKSVVNMSLGGGKNTTVNTAVRKLYDAGITVVVAAGNNGTLASNTSPASALEAITVGASTRRDFVATFSNHGSAVDIFAPGLYILSATPGGTVDAFSGTSMACPHVAGVVALLMESINDYVSPTVVRGWLVENAHTNRLTKLPINTSNRLLHKAKL
jgi:subtilisin family serine protease